MTVRATFTKADLARAAAVAKEHGFMVEIERDGTIRLVPAVDKPPVDAARLMAQEIARLSLREDAPDEDG